MTGGLAPGTKIAADAVAVRFDGLSGFAALAAWPGGEVGVWEHSPGVSEDVEEDEVFVVISGAATIDFLEPSLPALHIGPGDIVRLPEGAHTRWTITENLRKVYVTMPTHASRPGAAQEGIPS